MPTKAIPLIRAMCAFVALGISAAASAQAWPAKPVRIIVNFPPGGAADMIARAIAPGPGELRGIVCKARILRPLGPA